MEKPGFRSPSIPDGKTDSAFIYPATGFPLRDMMPGAPNTLP